MHKFIGNKHFYRKVFRVMIPVLIQNVITNFVSLLDNVMVGRIGTEPMSGVAIVSQLLFVYNLCLFGGISGCGIFTAQYFGKGDHEGVRNTFRSKIYFIIGAFAVFGGIFAIWGDELISLYVHESDSGLDLALAFESGREYLRIMLWQMPLFALVNVYASTMKETGETQRPMQASVVAVFVNLIGNYILIYGKFGAPALGVRGAAIATVIARVVELGLLIVEVHNHPKKYEFATGLYSTFKVPKVLVKRIIVTGFPLMINEVLWSFGITYMGQIFSRMGLEVISADNIAATVSNLFFSFYGAASTATAIIVGQLLGAGQIDQAVDEDRKLIAFTTVLCVAVGAVMAALSPVIPRVYNTTDQVRSLATAMLLVIAIMLPCNGFCNACYFTLRSGGKTWITFMFDGGFMWVISVTVTWFLVEKTNLSIIPAYAISYSVDFLKCVMGYILVKKKTWVNNLVES